jgi:hypothetical protein
MPRIRKKTDRAAYEWNTCDTRAEWKLNVVGEGGFLMLDPVGQGVLCG